jgi:DNA processing protein
MDEQRIAYLALTQVPGLGPSGLALLLSHFHSPLGAFRAPSAFLGTVPGCGPALVSAVKSTPLQAGRDLVDAADRVGATILIPGDEAFPPALTLIPEPPPVLFALGNLGLLQRPAVAIVGSRDHSTYGAEVCRMLAREAAWAGVVVVSGMARGLDAVAHSAALDERGDTIGVLGNGLGVVYPAANRALYDRVMERGLLLTEFPPGERPHAGSFPRRNRLISGLARVTVVVEAAIGSGALITAGTAVEQGREVLVVPGPLTSAVSAGANRLIRDGAAPFLEADDLLRHYPEAVRVDRPNEPGLSPDLPATLTANERAVATLLDAGGVHVDDLAARSGQNVSATLALLCALEIMGVAEQLPGRMFRRASRLG